jgi:hypothetical protein
MRSITLLLPVLLLYGCTGDKNADAKSPVRDSTVTTDNTRSFVSRPLPAVEDVGEEFTLDAARGDTMVSRSGSILFFPPASIVDADGKPVQGEVRITYTEYRDPFDFFLSGIPMDYQSGDSTFTFESAGMMKINALFQGRQAYPNPQAKPVIYMSSTTADAGYNTYRLDTVNRRWEDLGRSEPIVVSGNPALKTPPPAATSLPEAPVKPVKPSGRPLFEIEIDANELHELSAFRNAKFEVHESVKNFDPGHTRIEWTDVKVDRTAQHGVYNVTFSKPGQKVSYLARPVLEGRDYETALKDYEQRNDKYRRLTAARQAKENASAAAQKAWDEKEARIVAENEKTKRLNAIITAKNIETIRQNAITEALNNEMKFRARELAIQKRISDSTQAVLRIAEKKELERTQRINGLVLGILRNDPAVNTADPADLAEARLRARPYLAHTLVYRTLELDRFGTYNEDHPLAQAGEFFDVTYQDADGNTFSPAVIYFKDPAINGVFQFHSQQRARLRCAAGYAAWAVRDANIYYVRSSEFRTPSMPGTGRLTLRMNTLDVSGIKDPAQLRALVN